MRRLSGGARSGLPLLAGQAAGAHVRLVMIVKDESRVIERALESVRGHVDSWCVADTGSTDDTRDRVRDFFARHELPGVLLDHPWKDFSHNRNRALAAASADRTPRLYLLALDADDVFVGDAVAAGWPDLDQDGYYLPLDYGASQYSRIALFRADAGFAYKGVLHEVLVPPPGARLSRLSPSPSIRVIGGGHHNQNPTKYLEHAMLLQEERRRDPASARTVFYLAQSWRDAGVLEKALAVYEERAAMGGWDEEVYEALYQVARAREHLGHPEDQVIAAHLRAFAARPTRAEPLSYLASYLRRRGYHPVAHMVAERAARIPVPTDVLFVDQSVYRWRARDEWAVASYWVGDHATAARLNREALADPHLPESERPRVEKNLQFSLDELRRQGAVADQEGAAGPPPHEERA